MPRFRLLSAEGDDLGLFHAARRQWASGDRIQRGDGEHLVVARLVPAEPSDEVDGYVIVHASIPAAERGL